MIELVTCNGTAEEALLEKLYSRAQTTGREVEQAVQKIIERVKTDGDAALLEFTERFDGVRPAALEVPREAINDALSDADPALLDALLNAQENITAFHQRQKSQSMVDLQAGGVVLGQRVRGLSRVGLYVPGGTAAYPSTVLMNAIPAKIAGVGELIMVTPPGKDGKPNKDILLAAALCGVDRVFLCGGAQAVAALSYGTQSIPKVDKIVGPGNIYVATAKKLLYGVVDIDMIAGPSEILIMADSSANPVFVAADMLSQAEHDRLASSILLTDSETLAKETVLELERQLAALPRQEIARESLQNYGAILICSGLPQMISLANRLAPEHLEVLCNEPFELLGELDNAGSIFLGHYSPEPLGDYYAGPNHVLPTSGTARFFSPLSVESFTKRVSFIHYTKAALTEAANDIMTIANAEGLTAHAQSVRVRLDS